MARQRARTPPPHSLCTDSNFLFDEEGRGAVCTQATALTIVKKGIKGLWKKRYYQISQRLCICWRQQLGRLVKIESNTLTKPLLNVSEDLFSSSMRINPPTLWLTIKGEIRVVVGLILHCVSALAQARIRQSFVLFSGYERFFVTFFFLFQKRVPFGYRKKEYLSFEEVINTSSRMQDVRKSSEGSGESELSDMREGHS